MPLQKTRTKKKKISMMNWRGYMKCPKSDIKLKLGDSAKVAYEDENENIGKYGLHTEYNDNGRKLLGFATSYNMVTD